MLESPLTRFTTSHHNPSFPVIPLAVLVAGLLIAAAGRLDAGRFMGPQSGEFPDEPFEPIALEAHQCHGPFHPKNYPTKELYFPRVPYIYIIWRKYAHYISKNDQTPILRDFSFAIGIALRAQKTQHIRPAGGRGRCGWCQHCQEPNDDNDRWLPGLEDTWGPNFRCTCLDLRWISWESRLKKVVVRPTHRSCHQICILRWQFSTVLTRAFTMSAMSGPKWSWKKALPYSERVVCRNLQNCQADSRPRVLNRWIQWKDRKGRLDMCNISLDISWSSDQHANQFGSSEPPFQSISAHRTLSSWRK